MVRELYDGTRKTGLTVREDAFWPGMWRIHTPDGKSGDMVNTSRATDAALLWLSRNATHHNTRSTFKWIPATARSLTAGSKFSSDLHRMRGSQNKRTSGHAGRE